MNNELQEKVPIDELRQVTLAESIEENHKLLSVLGVFTALTVFTGSSLFTRNAVNALIGYLLSFMFMTISILVWIEVWRRFSSLSRPKSLQLVLFNITLLGIVVVIVFYWLFSYIGFLWVIMQLAILVGLAAAMLAILLRIPIIRKMFDLAETRQGEGRIKKRLSEITAIGIMVAVVFGAAYLALPILKGLDSLAASIDTYVKTEVPKNLQDVFGVSSSVLQEPTALPPPGQETTP